MLIVESASGVLDEAGETVEEIVVELGDVGKASLSMLSMLEASANMELNRLSSAGVRSIDVLDTDGTAEIDEAGSAKAMKECTEKMRR
jgi:hypothetical protein